MEVGTGDLTGPLWSFPGWGRKGEEGPGDKGRHLNLPSEEPKALEGIRQHMGVAPLIGLLAVGRPVAKRGWLTDRGPCGMILSIVLTQTGWRSPGGYLLPFICAGWGAVGSQSLFAVTPLRPLLGRLRKSSSIARCLSSTAFFSFLSLLISGGIRTLLCPGSRRTASPWLVCALGLPGLH